MCLKSKSVYIRPIELPSEQDGRGMRHSSSYEDFKQNKQHEMGSVSGRSETASPAPSFGIRKARSDPDVNRHNMTKELEVSLCILYKVICNCAM